MTRRLAIKDVCLTSNVLGLTSNSYSFTVFSCGQKSSSKRNGKSLKISPGCQGICSLVPMDVRSSDHGEIKARRGLYNRADILYQSSHLKVHLGMTYWTAYYRIIDTLELTHKFFSRVSTFSRFRILLLFPEDKQ